MSSLNPDFIERYAALERRVRKLEQTPSSYMESVILVGPLDPIPDIPPFFTPFGGAIVAVFGRFLFGEEVNFNVTKNGVSLFDDDIIILSAATTVSAEIDPPVYLEESDTVQAVITGIVDAEEGLSVGIVIHP